MRYLLARALRRSAYRIAVTLVLLFFPLTYPLILIADGWSNPRVREIYALGLLALIRGERV